MAFSWKTGIVKTEGAHILRLRDALKPEEATTPLKRAYYIAQLAVAGMMPYAEAAEILIETLEQSSDFPEKHALVQSVAKHEFYQVMRCLRDRALSDRAPRPHKLAQAR